MGAIIDRTYKGCGHNHNSKWDNLKDAWHKVTKLGVNVKDTEGVYSEVDELDTGTISEKLFSHTRKELNSNISSTFPNSKYGDKDYDVANKLIKNIDNFSAYKSQFFTNLLKNATDDKRSDILAIYSRQLKVESAMASKSIESVAKWEEHLSTQDLYPNIEYMKSRGVEKRSEHLKLVGTVRAVNDPWWSNNYPPSAWGCDCWTRSTDKPITAGTPSDVKPVKGISGNAGKSQTIFKTDHPFIANNEKLGHAVVKNNLDLFKQNIPYNKTPDYIAKNKSKLFVNTYYHKSDIDSNFIAAKLMVDQVPSMIIKIRPHSEGKTGIGKYKRSNPEYLINGKLADLKEPKSFDVENTYKSALKQDCKIILFKIKDSVKIEDVIESINGNISYRIRNGKGNPIDEIYILHKGKITVYKPQKS